MNGFIKRRFSIIKEITLEMLLNSKLNYTAQKMMWGEAIHTFKHVRNSMAIRVSTTSPFKNYYEDDGWIAEICDVEAAFLYPNMVVEMYIEYPKSLWIW